MIAICFPALRASFRIIPMRLMWSFRSPWEKFIRAASIPARMSLAMTAGALDAGPMVAMILVLFGITTPDYGTTDEHGKARHSDENR
jgi:hypothetical protein